MIHELFMWFGSYLYWDMHSDNEVIDVTNMQDVIDVTNIQDVIDVTNIQDVMDVTNIYIWRMWTVPVL